MSGNPVHKITAKELDKLVEIGNELLFKYDVSYLMPPVTRLSKNVWQISAFHPEKHRVSTREIADKINYIIDNFDYRLPKNEKVNVQLTVFTWNKEHNKIIDAFDIFQEYITQKTMNGYKTLSPSKKSSIAQLENSMRQML